MLESPVRESGETIRVAIAEDHEQVRKALARMIRMQKGMELVGEASDGLDALDTVEASSPDVLMVDIRMPGMDGIRVIENLRERKVPIRIIVLSAHEDEAYISEAMKHGADAYILKGQSMRSVVDTIRDVAEGKSVLSPEVTRPLLKHYRNADAVQVSMMRAVEGSSSPIEIARDCASDILAFLRAELGCLYRLSGEPPACRRVAVVDRDNVHGSAPEDTEPWLSLFEDDIVKNLERLRLGEPVVMNKGPAASGAEQGAEGVSAALMPVRCLSRTIGVFACCGREPFSLSPLDFRHVMCIAGEIGFLLESVEREEHLSEAESRLSSMQMRTADLISGGALGGMDDALTVAGLAFGADCLFLLGPGEGRGLAPVARWGECALEPGAAGDGAKELVSAVLALAAAGEDRVDLELEGSGLEALVPEPLEGLRLALVSINGAGDGPGAPAAYGRLLGVLGVVYAGPKRGRREDRAVLDALVSFAAERLRGKR